METVNYDIEIKEYQFVQKVNIIKKGSQGQRTGLTTVFEEGVWNKVRCNC